METKQEYKVLNEEAWASVMQLYVNFEVDGNAYEARATYVNGGWIEDIEVNDINREEVDNKEIYAIGESLIYDLDICKHLTC